MSNPLHDNEFLKELFSQKTRITYARVTSLTNDEKPRESLEGRISSGSVNLDGNSSMRRTCSLTLLTNESQAINDYYWALTTKFKLEIGLENNINAAYPNIIYFPLGVYIITSFNMSYGTNNFSISIQGKDKMCLLNGEVGGAIYSSVDFGTIEEKDEDGNITIRDYEIEDIIRESVHEYAGEPFHNIIIQDLPKYGLHLYQYNGDDYCYALIGVEDSTPANVVINPNATYTIWNSKDPHVADGTNGVEISSEDKIEYLTFNQLIDIDETKFTRIADGKNATQYYVLRIAPGQAAGYKLTTLTYPRDEDDTNSGLVSSIGGTLTSILDKIVDMLGDYEYFYNVDGQFVFQKKNKYIDTNWGTNDFDTSGMGNPYVLVNSFPNSWEFGNGELITTYSNSPDLSNIKNDYSIWGTRTSSTGNELPIHLRYAIDTKPEIYTRIHITDEEVQAFQEFYPEYTKLKSQESVTFVTQDYATKNGLSSEDEGIYIVDWREIIYRMALDYRKFNHWDSFNIKIMEANGNTRYPGGVTGYEQYYVDIEGFWRELYYIAVEGEEDDDEYEYEILLDSELELLNTDLSEIKDDEKRAIIEAEIAEIGDIYVRDNINKEITNKLLVYDSTSGEAYVDSNKISIYRNSTPFSSYGSNLFESYTTSQALEGVKELTYARNIVPNNKTAYNASYKTNFLYYYYNLWNYNTSSLLIELDSETDDTYYKGKTIITGIDDKIAINYPRSYNTPYSFYNITNYKYATVFPIDDGEYTLENLKNMAKTMQSKFNLSAENFYAASKENKFSFNRIYKVDKKYYIFDQTGDAIISVKEVTIGSDGILKYASDSSYVMRTRYIPTGPNDDSNYRPANIEKNIGYYGTLRTEIILTSKVISLDYVIKTSSIDTDNLIHFHITYSFTDHRCEYSKLIIEKDLNRILYQFLDKSANTFSFDNSKTSDKDIKLLNNTEIKELYINPVTNKINSYIKLLDRDKMNDVYYLDEDGNKTTIKAEKYYYKKQYITYYKKVAKYSAPETEDGGWIKEVRENPELLNFWFDFLDSPDSEIGKYSTKLIQDRSKATNENNATAIYYRDALNVIYLTGEDEESRLIGYAEDTYTLFNVSENMLQYFTISDVGKSCKEVLDSYLYSNTYANETVNISAIPIYHLEPGERIILNNTDTHIGGQYIINTISLPLAYNGTMTINATKAIDKLY